LLHAGSASSADYCCVCRGASTGKTVQAGDDFSAGFDCSLACKRPTLPRPGQCPAAAVPAPVTPAAPAAAGATPPAASPGDATGSVLLYSSEDCSGDASKVSTSVPDLAERNIRAIRSFAVESGMLAAVWQKAGYAGGRTEPVGPSICVSPGWEVGAVRLAP
jgi:hypothetical protein